MFIKYATSQIDFNKIIKNASENKESFSTIDIVSGRLVIGDYGAGTVSIGYLKGFKFNGTEVVAEVENAELGNPVFQLRNVRRVNFNVAEPGVPLLASIGKFYNPELGYVMGCNGKAVEFKPISPDAGDDIYTREVNSVNALEPYTDDSEAE